MYKVLVEYSIYIVDISYRELLEDFQNIPTIFKEEVFTRAFEKAELANLKPAEMDTYENSLKIYRDLKSVIDTAFGDGRK